jgi:hypothetical protein
VVRYHRLAFVHGANAGQIRQFRMASFSSITLDERISGMKAIDLPPL